MEGRNEGKELIEAFRLMDTPSISDAMDRLGMPCALLGIRPVVEGTKLCGPAFTVHYTACGQKRGTVGDFLDDVERGDVVVIANGGRLDCTVWGDIMSLYASLHGIGGTVIDGVCRDVPVIRALRYPVFSKGCYMSTGKDRVFVDAVNVPVSICNVQVCPNDLMIADDSGAVTVPFEQAKRVLEVALEISEKERQIEEQIRAGMRLSDARRQTGYHTLQTRSKEGR